LGGGGRTVQSCKKDDEKERREKTLVDESKDAKKSLKTTPGKSRVYKGREAPGEKPNKENRKVHGRRLAGTEKRRCEEKKKKSAWSKKKS